MVNIWILYGYYMDIIWLPSGKLTQLWKDPPFLMGKLTINGHVQ